VEGGGEAGSVRWHVGSCTGIKNKAGGGFIYGSITGDSPSFHSARIDACEAAFAQFKNDTDALRCEEAEYLESQISGAEKVENPCPAASSDKTEQPTGKKVTLLEVAGGDWLYDVHHGADSQLVQFGRHSSLSKAFEAALTCVEGKDVSGNAGPTDAERSEVIDDVLKHRAEEPAATGETRAMQQVREAGDNKAAMPYPCDEVDLKAVIASIMREYSVRILLDFGHKILWRIFDGGTVDILDNRALLVSGTAQDISSAAQAIQLAVRDIRTAPAVAVPDAVSRMAAASTLYHADISVTACLTEHDCYNIAVKDRSRVAKFARYGLSLGYPQAVELAITWARTGREANPL